MTKKSTENQTVAELMHGYWSDRISFRDDNMVGLKRGASYTRFSSDAQSRMSITRQDEVIEAYCKRGGYPEISDTHKFSDEAKSGSNTDREGLRAMLASAARLEFDVLFLEDLDRLSRDLADLAAIHKELKHLGIEIHTSTYGRVTDIHVAFYGLLGMEQRLALRRRTSLGRWIASIKGSNAQGKAYGYRTGRKAGRLNIVKQEAEVVREIFQWFFEGLTPVQIASLLNERRVAAPMGGKWSAQTIVGTGKYGTGILRNPKYVGVLVYGRTEVLPGTGGRKRNLAVRPEEKWLYVEKPSWTIVERRLWVAVQLQLAKRREMAEIRTRAAKARSEGEIAAPPTRVALKARSTDLFHGLYRCTCGSQMNTFLKDRSARRKIVCYSASKFRVCKNKRAVSLSFFEVDILRAIRDRIACEDARQSFVEEYAAEIERIKASAAEETQRRTARIKELDFMLQRSVLQAIYEDVEEEVTALRKQWKKEKKEHQDKLRALMPPPAKQEIASKIQTVENLAAQIDELIVRVPMAARTEAEMRLVAALRSLVLQITVDAPSGQMGYRLSVRTTLSGLAGDLRSLREKLPAQTLEIEGVIVRGPAQLALAEKKARLIALAERNPYATTDTDWASLEPELATFAYVGECNRLLFDTALFHLRTGVPLKNLPAPYGGRPSIPNGVKNMADLGYFMCGVATLERNGSDTVAGLDTTKLISRVRVDDRGDESGDADAAAKRKQSGIRSPAPARTTRQPTATSAIAASHGLFGSQC